jgi:hypothetical protein
MNYKQFVDIRNRELVDFIKAENYHIRVKHSKKETWTIDIIDKQIIIGIKQSDYPVSCFTHELLHAEIQIKGFKRLRYGKSSLFPNNNFGILMEALDQELQHHKMFKRFADLGFPPEEFYYDNDKQIISKLDKFISSGNHELLPVLLRYFTVISPGGAIELSILIHYKELLKSLMNNAFRNTLDEIDIIFRDWTNSPNLDAEPFIKRYFINIGSPSKTWIGYGKPHEFPNNGFFIEEVFSV